MCITRHHEGTRLTCYDLKKNGAALYFQTFEFCSKMGSPWVLATCPLGKNIEKNDTYCANKIGNCTHKKVKMALMYKI